MQIKKKKKKSASKKSAGGGAKARRRKKKDDNDDIDDKDDNDDEEDGAGDEEKEAGKKEKLFKHPRKVTYLIAEIYTTAFLDSTERKSKKAKETVKDMEVFVEQKEKGSIFDEEEEEGSPPPRVRGQRARRKDAAMDAELNEYDTNTTSNVAQPPPSKFARRRAAGRGGRGKVTCNTSLYCA